MNDRTKSAVEALLDYKQADMDGIMVETSRQAIHEVVDALAERDARIAELEGIIAAPQTMLALMDRVKELEAQTQWQDIATAPKDGTEVDLWVCMMDRLFRIPDCRYGTEPRGKELGWLECRRDEVETFLDSWQFIDAVPLYWMKPQPPQAEGE